MYLVSTYCMLCGDRHNTTQPVTMEQIKDYESGTLVQDAFPFISADNREILKSALRTKAYLCDECVADDDV